MDNIVNRNAPVYFEQVDGCVTEWYDGKSEHLCIFSVVVIDLSNTINNIFTDMFQPNTIMSSKYRLPVNRITMNANMEIIVY